MNTLTCSQHVNHALYNVQSIVKYMHVCCISNALNRLNSYSFRYTSHNLAILPVLSQIVSNANMQINAMCDSLASDKPAFLIIYDDRSTAVATSHLWPHIPAFYCFVADRISCNVLIFPTSYCINMLFCNNAEEITGGWLCNTSFLFCWSCLSSSEPTSHKYCFIVPCTCTSLQINPSDIVFYLNSL